MNIVPRIEDFADPDFDPSTVPQTFPDFAGDPFEGLRGVVDRGGPVQEGTLHSLLTGTSFHDPKRRHFAVLGSAQARAVLGDPELFSGDAYGEEIRQSFGRALNVMEPQEHGRYRRVLQKIFLPHVVARWSETFVQPVIEELVAELKKAPRAELVSQFTHRYPFQIIFRQLAMPAEDVAIFQKLAETLSLRTSDMAVPLEAKRKLGDYLSWLIEERRRHPGPDLISELIQAEMDGERLPDDLLVSFFRQLLNAAGDTTFRATGNLLVGLLRERPDQYRQLVEDRSLVPQAIEEVMRWNGPIIAIYRQATRDTELAGVEIPADSYVEVLYASVGHDLSFHEDPERFDLTRHDTKRHLGFGYGSHVCIGQHLARLEMTRALDAMLTHFPNMRLDPDYPPPVIRGWGLRSPDAIHVLLD